MPPLLAGPNNAAEMFSILGGLRATNNPEPPE